MNRISIVTICFNNLKDLQVTCASVDQQRLRPFEHLIIDGSTSTDIRNWLLGGPQPPFRSIVSERDNGISDAFNKGINRSRGDIIVMLNAGDTLYEPGVLEKVTGEFEKNPGITWCHGSLEILRGDQWVIIGKRFDPSKLYRGMRSTFHPTMYVKKELYDRYGGYDTSLKMAMDYDFLCRIAHENFRFIDYPLAKFDPEGVSSEKYLEAMRESYACYRKYYGYSLKQQLWGLRQSLLHYLLKSPFGKWLYRLKVKSGLQNA